MLYDYVHSLCSDSILETMTIHKLIIRTLFTNITWGHAFHIYLHLGFCPTFLLEMNMECELQFRIANQ